MAQYIFPTPSKITREQREQALTQKSKLIWFTGLSGSGKTTLATRLEVKLFEKGFKTYILDGDNIRSGLSSDLTFSAEDRTENIRRVAEVSKLFLNAGIIVLAAFISPFKADREMVKGIVGAGNYIEVFLDCPLEVCERRDVKGLYSKARAGEIRNFTGIDSPYEQPDNPEITIHSDKYGISDSIDLLVDALFKRVSS